MHFKCLKSIITLYVFLNIYQKKFPAKMVLTGHQLVVHIHL